MQNNRKLLVLKVEDKEVKIMQRKDMFCISLDTILLTNFIKLKNSVKQVIDFGTNNGAIALLLGLKYQTKILGIEIQTEAVDLAKENVKLNDLEDRISIINEDIKVYAEQHRNNNEKKVDAIVCNPPFFALNSNIKLKIEPLKSTARHETYIDLNTIVNSAAALLKQKGKLFIVYHVQRLNELLITLNNNKFYVQRMQIVYPKINKEANAVLIEANYQNKETRLVIEPPLICHNSDNSYNPEIAKWYNNSN